MWGAAAARNANSAAFQRHRSARPATCSAAGCERGAPLWSQGTKAPALPFGTTVECCRQAGLRSGCCQDSRILSNLAAFDKSAGAFLPGPLDPRAPFQSRDVRHARVPLSTVFRQLPFASNRLSTGAVRPRTFALARSPLARPFRSRHRFGGGSFSGGERFIPQCSLGVRSWFRCVVSLHGFAAWFRCSAPTSALSAPSRHDEWAGALCPWGPSGTRAGGAKRGTHGSASRSASKRHTSRGKPRTERRSVVRLKPVPTERGCRLV
jgi:hypothetical protein